MKVLLLASGVATRWAGPMLKQLAPVAGQPVLVRTLDQLNARGVESVVVTHEPDIEAAVRGKTQLFYSPASYHWPNTFLDSESLWLAWRLGVFHADVAWDDKALDIVLASKGLGFYGTRKGPWENFAIAFDPQDYDRMKVAAQRALDICGPDAKRCGTWEVYRALVGIPLDQTHRFEGQVWHELKESVDSDYTFDFDTLAKYNTWLSKNPWARSS